MTLWVENMVTDSQNNTYTFSRIMHLPYFYMRNDEQLDVYSVAEACVCESPYSNAAVTNLKT